VDDQSRGIVGSTRADRLATFLTTLGGPDFQILLFQRIQTSAACVAYARENRSKAFSTSSPANVSA
jgi:hypothetical protein